MSHVQESRVSKRDVLRQQHKQDNPNRELFLILPTWGPDLPLFPHMEPFFHVLRAGRSKPWLHLPRSSFVERLELTERGQPTCKSRAGLSQQALKTLSLPG